MTRGGYIYMLKAANSRFQSRTDPYPVSLFGWRMGITMYVLFLIPEKCPLGTQWQSWALKLQWEPATPMKLQINRTGMWAPLLSSDKRRIWGPIKLKLEFFSDAIFIIYGTPTLSLFQICLGKYISCRCSHITITIWVDDQISQVSDLSEKSSLVWK